MTLPLTGQAASLVIKNEHGEAMARVMVTRTPLHQPAGDLSDDGYAPHGVTNVSATVQTRFTDASGVVHFDATDSKVRYRARAQGYVDVYFDAIPDEVVMQDPVELSRGIDSCIRVAEDWLASP